MENKAGGVILTAEELNKSKANKTKKMRTTAQLPAFRTAAALLKAVHDVMKDAPKSERKFTDQLVADTAELMKSVALANENRGAERVFYINSAISCLFTVKAEFAVLKVGGILGNDALNKIHKLCDGEMSQLCAWRDFTEREGHILENKEGI